MLCKIGMGSRGTLNPKVLEQNIETPMAYLDASEDCANRMTVQPPKEA